ncbi:HTH_48 domain-containing protein [Trichonephila clavipes]|nr:HTH_48 domain-containing protein [Trichonephila clavipes]
MYGNSVMNESSLRKWCIQFKNGRTNIHDEEKSERPSIVTDELVAKIDEKILENHRFTITEKFVENVFEIVTQAPFTWTKIAGNIPERIRFVPVYTMTRQNAGSNCRSIFRTLFHLGFLRSPMMHCTRNSRWLLLSSARVGQ